MAKETQNSPEEALKKSSNYLKIPLPPLQTLPLYRWALQAVETSLSHPALPLIWQQFFIYYFQRIKIPEQHVGKSMGRDYFKSGPQLVLLKKMKAQIKKAIEHYNGLLESSNTEEPVNIFCANEYSEQEVIEKSRFYLNLLNLFRAFEVWIDDKDLHSLNLCLSALQPIYQTERLKLLFDNDQSIWFNFVSIAQIKEELNVKLHSWDCKALPNVNEDMHISSNEESLVELISRHLSQYNTVLPVKSDMSLEVPSADIIDVSLTSWDTLVLLIEKDQGVIFEKARQFSNLMSRLKQLNFNYTNWVPQMYNVEDSEIILTKSCYKGEKSTGCTGAATFKLEIQKYCRNERIHERIEFNRNEAHVVLDELLKLPVYELCAASVHVENSIKALARQMKMASPEASLKFRRVGIALFYHQMKVIDKIMASVSGYTPSRQFFSCSIESLGKEFIDNQEDQLLNLVETILNCATAGVLASPLFNPNIASTSVFLNIYKRLCSSVHKSSSNTLLVLLSKVDLQLWLREKKVDFSCRKQIFKETCNALISCGCSISSEILPVYEVFKKHFTILITFMFPELYSDAVSFLLNGMNKGKVSTDMWYEALHCFGCSKLCATSTFQDIEIAVKKFAANQQLPPDQQIFVSSQPLNIYQVTETLDLLHENFIWKDNSSSSLYHHFQTYIKPFGIFTSILNHSYLCLQLEDVVKHGQVLSVSHIWSTLNRSFSIWLHPVLNGAHMTFPWSDDEVNNASFMFEIFTMCLKYFHERLMEHNCEKYILSYLWEYYIQTYVAHGYRHYSVSLCHCELLKLPWHQFHPDAEDIEGMCIVLKSDLDESKEFLAKVSLEIPWLEVMSHISSTRSPEYIGKTLRTLAELLIRSSWDASFSKKKFHLNELKDLEKLPWYYLKDDDVKYLLELYYSGRSIQFVLSSQDQNLPDAYILQFLKCVCHMTVNSNAEGCSNLKRFLFLHNYIINLTLCISSKRDIFEQNMDKYKAILPSLLKDIEVVISKDLKSDEQITHAVPLVGEVISILNGISYKDLEVAALNSIVSWLSKNPQSILLLPCLKSSGSRLSSMENVVSLCECCISSRLNTEITGAADAHKVFQLISSCFRVPSGHSVEFVKVCVERKAYLTLYCYVLLKLPSTQSTDSKKQLLSNIFDWMKRSKVCERSEAKALLLWDKFLELSIILAFEDELQVVQRMLLSFCSELTSLSEDRINSGFFGAIGYGRHSNLTVNFRFLCSVMATYIHLQVPNNAPIRLEANAPGYLTDKGSSDSHKKPLKLAEPSPSADALKSIEKLKSLLDKKQYSALHSQVIHAINCAVDPKNSMCESRQLLRQFAMLVFPKETFLHALS